MNRINENGIIELCFDEIIIIIVLSQIDIKFLVRKL